MTWTWMDERQADAIHHAVEPLVVAEIYDPATGEKMDECWSWETGQNYARGNYKVVAIADDRACGKDEAQAIYDYERRLAQDCWGLGDNEAMEEW